MYNIRLSKVLQGFLITEITIYYDNKELSCIIITEITIYYDNNELPSIIITRNYHLL